MFDEFDDMTEEEMTRRIEKEMASIAERQRYEDDLVTRQSIKESALEEETREWQQEMEERARAKSQMFEEFLANNQESEIGIGSSK